MKWCFIRTEKNLWNFRNRFKISKNKMEALCELKKLHHSISLARNCKKLFAQFEYCPGIGEFSTEAEQLLISLLEMLKGFEYHRKIGIGLRIVSRSRSIFQSN